jgi:thiamine-phosphate pyrophosphorylase
MSAAAATARAPRLMLIVTVDDVHERRAAIAAALAAGVDAVQLRDRRAAGGALLAAARELGALTRAAGAALLVNDRIDVALAAGAEGVHLPAASVPVAVARGLLGSEPWIGRSTHSTSEAAEAASEGADYVLLGPVFATPSKERYGPPLGLDAIAATRIPCPLIAIGGIDATVAPAVRAAGAHGVAVIRAILEAEDPARAAQALHTAITS